MKSLQPARPVDEVGRQWITSLWWDTSCLVIEPEDTHDHSAQNEELADEDARDLIEDTVVSFLHSDVHELVNSISEVETHPGGAVVFCSSFFKFYLSVLVLCVACVHFNCFDLLDPCLMFCLLSKNLVIWFVSSVIFLLFTILR